MMGTFSIACSDCKNFFLWFSGNKDQRCSDCIKKSVIDKFMEDNKDLMQDLAKQEDMDKIKIKLKELKTAHTVMGNLIMDLEDAIK